MNAGARDTINIDESVHEIYRQLTEGNDLVNAPFKTMKDIFLWSACLGQIKGERKPITGRKLTIFRWAQFSSSSDIPIIHAIALTSTNDVMVLLDQEEILLIAEEYANYGIHLLSTNTTQGDMQSLWKIQMLISSNR